MIFRLHMYKNKTLSLRRVDKTTRREHSIVVQKPTLSLQELHRF